MASSLKPNLHPFCQLSSQLIKLHFYCSKQRHYHDHPLHLHWITSPPLSTIHSNYTQKRFPFASPSPYFITFPGNYLYLIKCSALSLHVLLVLNNFKITFFMCLLWDSPERCQKFKCSEQGLMEEREGGMRKEKEGLWRTQCLCGSINIALWPWSHVKLIWRAHRHQRGDGEKTSACCIDLSQCRDSGAKNK